VPSGAPIGDELIEGRSADASATGYEYCSIHELLDSYTHLLQKTGDPAWADRIEWLLFNAGQGARHPNEPSIAYLKTDNSTSMTGKLHPSDGDDLKNPQTRYKYSPTHQDVAVCCVPNAGRIYPYYVKSMWLRTVKGLQAALFGPCEVNTAIKGVKVRIIEQTEYPFSHELIFKFDVEEPVEFELTLRKPSWVSGIDVQVDGVWSEHTGSIRILKIWKPGDQVYLHFNTQVITNCFRDSEYFLSYGPLVYAQALEGMVREGRQYPMDGFRDVYYDALRQPTAELRLCDRVNFVPELMSGDPEFPWYSARALNGIVLNASTNQLVPIRLVPMGGTILRRVTFRKAEN
jgi:DUF1680 family protein